jgi:hypothetical protein
VADIDYEDDKAVVENFVDDSVIPNTNSIGFLISELDATGRPGVRGKQFHAIDDSPLQFARHALKQTEHTRLVFKPINHALQSQLSLELIVSDRLHFSGQIISGAPFRNLGIASILLRPSQLLIPLPWDQYIFLAGKFEGGDSHSRYYTPFGLAAPQRQFFRGAQVGAWRIRRRSRDSTPRRQYFFARISFPVGASRFCGGTHRASV